MSPRMRLPKILGGKGKGKSKSKQAPPPPPSSKDKGKGKAPESSIIATTMVSDLRQQYGAPFMIANAKEGNRYLTLRSHAISCPRYIDWPLMRECNLEEQIVAYLKVLNLEVLAKMKPYAYDKIVLEFLTTFKYEDGAESCKFRMLDTEYLLTLRELRDYLDFGMIGIKNMPSPPKAAEWWKDISGLDDWHTKGIKSKLIQDPALSIVYKFLAYNISGKEQANKLNSTEVYLLWCAKNNRKVCPSKFILSNINDALTRSTQHPSFCLFIAALSFKIGALKEDELNLPSTYKRLDYHAIDLVELQRAELITKDKEVKPRNKRTCLGKLKNPQADMMILAGGSSMAHNEEGNEEGEEGGQEQGDPTHYPGYNMPVHDWQTFQGYMDSRLDNFQKSIADSMSGFSSSLTTHWQERDQRWEQQKSWWDTSFASLDHKMEEVQTDVKSINSRLDDHENSIKKLQESWDSWTLASSYFPINPPPPPPPEQ